MVGQSALRANRNEERKKKINNLSIRIEMKMKF